MIKRFLLFILLSLGLAMVSNMFGQQPIKVDAKTSKKISANYSNSSGNSISETNTNEKNSASAIEQTNKITMPNSDSELTRNQQNYITSRKK